MNKNEIFSKNLREIRKKQGYTQSQLAQKTGLSRRIIVHYENYVKDPVFDNTKKIADVLGVSIHELFGISETTSKIKESNVTYKIMKKVRLIEKLPVRDQNKIFNLINELIEKNKMKKDK